MWEIFRKPRPQKVTNGRFQIEWNGEVASLEYNLCGNILELTHTEVPKGLRGIGLASSLSEEFSTGRERTTSNWILFVRRCGNT